MGPWIESFSGWILKCDLLFDFTPFLSFIHSFPFSTKRRTVETNCSYHKSHHHYVVFHPFPRFQSVFSLAVLLCNPILPLVRSNPVSLLQKWFVYNFPYSMNEVLHLFSDTKILPQKVRHTHAHGYLNFAIAETSSIRYPIWLHSAELSTYYWQKLFLVPFNGEAVSREMPAAAETTAQDNFHLNLSGKLPIKLIWAFYIFFPSLVRYLYRRQSISLATIVCHWLRKSCRFINIVSCTRASPLRPPNEFRISPATQSANTLCANIYLAGSPSARAAVCFLVVRQLPDARFLFFGKQPLVTYADCRCTRMHFASRKPKPEPEPDEKKALLVL